MISNITHLSSKNDPRSFLSDLFKHRSFLFFLVWKELKVRYRKPILGLIWTSAQPLLYLVVMVLAYRYSVTESSTQLPFPLFVFSGLMFWQLFSAVINGTVQILFSNAGIMRKVYFPKFLIPLSAGIIGILEIIPVVVLWTVLVFYYGYSLSVIICSVLIIGVLLSLVSAVGTAAVLSIGVFRFPSLRHAIPLLTHILLFVCPILFPLERSGDGILNGLIQFIPITGPIETLRHAILGTPDFGAMAITALITPLILLLGITLYFLWEKNMADHA